MRKIDTVLFDFDGVIADTEPQYDHFFDGLTLEYKLGVDDFAAKLKGTRLPEALNILFPQFSTELKNKIIHATHDFEQRMDYPLIPGVMGFIDSLKSRGYKLGLVTSSAEDKMQVAMEKLQLNGVFDTEVMGGRITRGKPDPMCYLLAAQDVGSKPETCLVLEDSLAGIRAGNAAGMCVIGVASTLPEEKIQDLVCAVISDFRELDVIEKVLGGRV